MIAVEGKVLGVFDVPPSLCYGGHSGCSMIGLQVGEFLRLPLFPFSTHYF